MSAIIMIAAYSLIELHDLLFLWKIKAWKEISLLLATFTITFILGGSFLFRCSFDLSIVFEFYFF